MMTEVRTFSPIKYLNRQLAEDQLVASMIFTGNKEVAYAAASNFSIRAICESPKNEDYCGTCKECKLAQVNNHPDIIHIGTNDRVKIGDIKELQKTLYLKPFRAPYKVAIIENAETMTTEAANSFLKILEEPPGKSIIIIIVPDKKLLLETIVSRSQTINFGNEGSLVSEELRADIDKCFQRQSISDLFLSLSRYNKKTEEADAFINAAEIVLREVLLNKINGRSEDNFWDDYSEKELIEMLWEIGKAKEYRKNNVNALFVIENIFLNFWR